MIQEECEDDNPKNLNEPQYGGIQQTNTQEVDLTEMTESEGSFNEAS